MEDFSSDKQSSYDHVVQTLVQTFGEVMSEDVISTIVENFDGDLDESANAIMNMTSDNQKESQLNNTDNCEINSWDNKSSNNNNLSVTDNCENSWNHISKQTQNTRKNNYPQENKQRSRSNPSQIPGGTINHSSTSYSKVSQKKMKSRSLSRVNIPETDLKFWTNQMKKIIMHHNKGSRILILMRGAPGSGKTYLAKQILEVTIGSLMAYNTHIFSADDYFTVNGYYCFDKSRLSEAHATTQKKSSAAMEKGVSPIIIDNTNIELWEMEPYLREGAKFGYLIEIVEPNTSWAKKPNQLWRKNVHSVPIQSIKRMLENYDKCVNSQFLLHYYRITYPNNMIPPVRRNIPIPPALLENHSIVAITNVTETDETHQQKDNDIPLDKNLSCENQNVIAHASVQTAVSTVNNETKPDVINDTENENNKEYVPEQFTEIEKQLEEFAKVEAEWENGENWEDNSLEAATVVEEKTIDTNSPVNSKPQRKSKNLVIIETKSETENLLMECQDWTKIAMYMPPWDSDIKAEVETPLTVVEKVNSSTCVEIGDTDICNTKKVHKVISAVPRDINLHYMPPLHEEKVPEKRMLDKSSMTNEHVLMETQRCKHEEKHFKTFRRLFKNLPKSDLRDVFDSCCGDVNWAVSIVLDGVANNELSTLEIEDPSDTEEENQDKEEISDQCDCLAAYNIIPDVNIVQSPKVDEITEITVNSLAPTPKKMKKESVISESSINLKRQIEQNVVISDDHYSENVLKFRKQRRGEQPIQTVNSDNQVLEDVLPRSSKDDDIEINMIINTDFVNEENSDEADSCVDYIEKTVNIDLGSHFVTQLDEYFGRNNMIYPGNVKPIINIPISLLNEINALWMESLMDQLEDHSKQTKIMMKQDEEIARQLALKELELAEAGKEPEIPDFKEIMDMEFALSLYQKDIAEWRNNEPNDLAAKLSREKLYDLFPKISQDVLSELLMAHDNNFMTTVEGLLMSTGQSEILEKENGLNNFIMTKEMERQEKLLEEQKKALSEVEWPLLPKVKVDMKEVEQYRREADMHIAKRNLIYQKARECVTRGMTHVATYYSEVAAMHTRGFEKACCLAAASLIQVHSENSPDNATIDLHFLRVREARESVDLFLDAHIKKLQEIQQTSNVRHQTLYFITGRGLHSGGVARIKPAVKQRLRERGIDFKESNPGLLTAKINAGTKMTHQVV
ncbi:NEDD4-binding protein 2 [Battus philenor]|uniref:NEDD4-binding protein 2 n=1 Tax=Battus philenor TaxID=42288 RepID=UPI0035CF4E8D